ncbi:MAG TPA: VOC family protein [Jatrophihabitans sp.]|jgi:4a-hydroxytetrahydrobiopterin dehydratase
MNAPLTRTAASDAVEPIGWRYLLGAYQTCVITDDLAGAVGAAACAVAACGIDADTHLRVDVRPGRVDLVLQDLSTGAVVARDVELAFGITDSIRDLGFDTVAAPLTSRPVQMLEIAIDTLDIAAIRPFWKAVLAYVDDPGPDAPQNALVDPLREGPAFWFQKMDQPRPQRNRIHFDITVAHDQAQQRIAAALAAGGTMVSDAAARSFWILADVEGNEICVCTWQDRDPL